MRAVIQRVKRAEIKIEGIPYGDINRGILVLLGVEQGDSSKDVHYLADKILKLRIFNDTNSKMNLSIEDIKGEIMVVSQFTLLGDCSKGRRPSFTRAAQPQLAHALYEEFLYDLSRSNLKIVQGKFQATMEIYLINDGPVTLILDSKRYDH